MRLAWTKSTCQFPGEAVGPGWPSRTSLPTRWTKRVFERQQRLSSLPPSPPTNGARRALHAQLKYTEWTLNHFSIVPRRAQGGHGPRITPVQPGRRCQRTSRDLSPARCSRADPAPWETAPLLRGRAQMLVLLPASPLRCGSEGEGLEGLGACMPAGCCKGILVACPHLIRQRGCVFVPSEHAMQ